MQKNNSVQTFGPGLCGMALEDSTGLAGHLGNLTLHCWLHFLTREAGSELQGDSSNVAMRVVIALVYSAVCALGLVGNLLALYLLHSRHRHKQSSINCFVMGLALTDLQFVLTLPFWAVDTAMDFRWPFGKVMCKIVSSVTTMNMYASVFFLTAMSVARYCAVAFSLKMYSGRAAALGSRWVSLGIWVVSLLATLPHAVYSTSVQVSDDELCLVRFPESGSWDPQLLLGLYQTQKVLLGFVIPLVIISVCYLLLLRFVLSRRISASTGPDTEPSRHRRCSKVTKSIVIVVLSFFLCWLPNQALTMWGVLIKFDLVPFSTAFYNAQAYAFPLTVCLAHTNSCLNPLLYCLIRREFRAGLKDIVLRTTAPIRRLVCLPRKAKVAEAPPVLVLVQMDAGV
ncbi:relaxin family peptide receptor 3.2b [Brienomyrus brachyistius]|uniref:relaxin family peptide receptor 3.2b n=1 Tax=Brienomyrus brachyistius TaxID=42636 RepID=UPI0020B1FCC1|nr:relaxin family peptide receptor 3.2b [Brienomyrus brachyistius]